MPTLVGDRLHQINYSDIFRNDRKTQTKIGYNGLKLVKTKKNAAVSPETTHIPSDNMRFPSWTMVEDKILQKLISYHLSWNWISVAMGNRPISELKKHWRLIQYHGINGDDENKVVPSSSLNSASSSPGICDDQDKRPRPLQIQAVHYMNEEWSFEDIILLHKIAANWENERWLTITKRFSEKTGRSVKPEHAKSIIEF